jgi:phosphohistidine phosphatase SixA
MLRKLLCGLLLFPVLALAHHSQKYAGDDAARGLRNVTVLIVRHAEKPDGKDGPDSRGLTPRGEQRAQAYASYFDPLNIDGQSLMPQRLIATSDSKNSERPRLTLTPLAARLQLPLEQPFADKQVDKLVDSLRQQNQAGVVLIAWHHGELGDLIHAFGGDLTALTGKDKWPGDVFNWLIVLRFDDRGQLIASRSHLVRERLLPGD